MRRHREHVVSPPPFHILRSCNFTLIHRWKTSQACRSQKDSFFLISFPPSRRLASHQSPGARRSVSVRLKLVGSHCFSALTHKHSVVTDVLASNVCLFSKALLAGYWKKKGVAVNVSSLQHMVNWLFLSNRTNCFSASPGCRSSHPPPRSDPFRLWLVHYRPRAQSNWCFRVTLYLSAKFWHCNIESRPVYLLVWLQSADPTCLSRSFIPTKSLLTGNKFEKFVINPPGRLCCDPVSSSV